MSIWTLFWKPRTPRADSNQELLSCWSFFWSLILRAEFPRWQLRSNVFFSSPHISLSVFHFTAVAHAFVVSMFTPCSRGEGVEVEEWFTSLLLPGAYFREQAGFGCHRFSGLEPRARTLHLPVLRRRRRWMKRKGGGAGWGAMCQGQVLWMGEKRQAVIQ